jgi:DNA-binding NarL/FixJ family response regulator
MRCRTLIIDDSRTMRLLLAELLGEIPDVEVVGMAEDAATGIAMIASVVPDVVLIDLHMPGGGTTVLEHAHRADRGPRTVVLTAFPTAQHRQRCLDLGADIFLDKTSDLDYLEDRLRPIIDAVAAAR